MTHSDAQSVLDFWYSDDTRPFWFAKSTEFDARLHQQFGTLWQTACRGECAHWRNTLDGRLAEILVLDQFSRNLARNTPAAFAQDLAALVLAQEAVAHPEYATTAKDKQHFILMPYMHSESAAIHALAVPLFEALGNANTLDFELRHKAIIDRFGRYPHRNVILGRENTAQETTFLQEEGSSF